MTLAQTIATLQKKKSHLAKVSLDAAEHNGEATGLDVSVQIQLVNFYATAVSF